MDLATIIGLASGSILILVSILIGGSAMIFLNIPGLLIVVGGTIAAYGSARKPEPVLPFYKMMYKDLTVRMIIVYSMPDSPKDHAVADINSALSGGWLKHRIAHTMPLEDIAAGNELVEAGQVRGAVVLAID